MDDLELAKEALRLARDHHGGANGEPNTDAILDAARKFLAFLKESNAATSPAAGA